MQASLCHICTPETHTYLMIMRARTPVPFTAPSFENAKSIALKKGAVEVYYRLYPNKPGKMEDLEDDE